MVMETEMELAQPLVSRSSERVQQAVAARGIKKRLRPFEQGIRVILLLCGAVSILTTIGIVFVLGEESLLFLDSRAWVQARAPIPQETASATLTEPIQANETVLSIAMEAGRVPLQQDQFVEIGGEIMQITARGSSTITVKRGLEGTEAVAHTIDEPVFPMSLDRIEAANDLGGVVNMVDAEGAAVRPLDGISATQTEIALRAGQGSLFAAGDIIYLDSEVMRVTEATSNSITVERGLLGSLATEHGPSAAATQIDLSQTVGQELGVIANGPPAASLSQFQMVDVAEADTVIQFAEGRNFGQHFEVGDLVQLRNEIMRITAVTPDSITVERGVEGSRVRNQPAGGEPLQLPEDVSIVEFLTGTQWSPQVGDFGIWPLMMATLLTSLIALLVAVPLGLGAAIYLSEYASARFRNTVKPILEILAGVPTVVYGFFALTFITPGLQSIFEGVQFYNMLSAGVVIGILLLPMISSMGEDALSAVPQALREASFGLGATKLETTVKVVLPAAISGVLAAVILAMSRAVGETMIVALAAGAGPNFTLNLFEGAETMTGHIARISGGDLSYNSIDYNSIFAIGAMLFLLTLLLNLISRWVRQRLEEAY